MGYHPVTPFGRTVDAVLIKRQNQLQAASERMPAASSQLEPAKPVSKWNVLRDLAVARHHFGLSDRDLSVLQALLSFWSGTELPADRALVIHPSNQTICDRLNGMANSTMRRYLARLVDAGLLLRRDSPNGKRYARRYGGEKVAYGFDLSPLRQRAREIEMAAEDVRAEEFRLKRLRETVSLMRRDLAGLAEFGLSQRPDLPLWDRLGDLAALSARALRRKLTLADLAQMEAQLRVALDEARDILDPMEPVDNSIDAPVETPQLSTKAAEIEQHHQNSQKDSFESESEEGTDNLAEVSASPQIVQAEKEPQTRIAPPCPAKVTASGYQTTTTPNAPESTSTSAHDKLPNMPLSVTLAACTSIQNYIDHPIRHWHDLVKAAHHIRPMMGISTSAWEEALSVMGPAEAAVVLASMLERFEEIKNPGGYLRHLSAKSANGTFSCGPMVMALLRKH
ncbi:Plasmid replication protein RepC (plasmid) [Tritonibacter mobilis]|uniref:plasmid replication protein RepC n=1 Tax=Tritonibacter mobilis TaxID=379347 RepID=UPI000F6D647E|nr:plasmid replication protein RepC [Tritonibacter mobilis]VCU62085.1 Plasmid replication protein RepC [Tritonibacter mobilis]